MEQLIDFLVPFFLRVAFLRRSIGPRNVNWNFDYWIASHFTRWMWDWAGLMAAMNLFRCHLSTWPFMLLAKTSRNTKHSMWKHFHHKTNTSRLQAHQIYFTIFSAKIREKENKATRERCGINIKHHKQINVALKLLMYRSW